MSVNVTGASYRLKNVRNCGRLRKIAEDLKGGENMIKLELKAEEVWMIDFSEEWQSFVFYHKCGAITIVPEWVVYTRA